MKKITSLIFTASFLVLGSASAATVNITASDATYIRSNDADTNFQSGSTNVANDNSSNHRIAFYTFDFSSLSAADITGVTLSLTENIGGGTHEYEIYGLGTSVNLGSVTWNTAVTDGHVASNRPDGTSLATFNANAGSGTYDVTLSTAFFDDESDGLVTLAIADNNTGVNGIGWTDGAVLNVTSVPEPSSSALIGLGGLTLILRRKK